MTGFASEMQPKGYVAEINGRFGTRYRVFTTGNPKYYLFVCIEDCRIQFPVLKARLRPDVRKALAHGMGDGPPDRERAIDVREGDVIMVNDRRFKVLTDPEDVTVECSQYQFWAVPVDADDNCRDIDERELFTVHWRDSRLIYSQVSAR
jgi:hypothetical protein